MGSLARVGSPMTLEEFLELPEQKPVLEFIDGRIEARASGQIRRSVLILRVMHRLNAFADPVGLGLALPVLRCTFAGWSIVPDVSFLLSSHIPLDACGGYEDVVRRPPDLHVEILSPDHSARRSREKLAHSTSQDCPLGWFIDSDRKVVEVYRTDHPVEVAAGDDVLDGEPVLPGFRLPVAEVFGWLRPSWSRNSGAPRS